MRNSPKIAAELASILLIPFIKDLVERCINMGFEVEDIIETLRQTVESIVKTTPLVTSDLRDIEYENFIELERFLEKLIEVASERYDTNAPSTGSPPPSSELDGGDSSSPKSQKRPADVNMMTRNPQEDERNLRPIVVDGSDVGFCESSQTFELSRIKAVVDYFEKRRHRIFVILPQWRKDQILSLPNTRRTNSPTSSAVSSTQSGGFQSGLNANSTTMTSTNTDSNFALSGVDPGEELERMVKRGILHYTPTRVPSKFKYQEDSAILELAKKKNAVIVSNDNYKKFSQDDKFKEVIEERVLPYTIIDDEFLPSLSALGNTLENFLRFEPLQDSKFNKKCPYMQKNRCTFGAKCKYWHPERGVIAMGPNQGTSQAPIKTAHQKINETVSEQKMRFQIILNETIQTSLSRQPSGGTSGMLVKEEVSKPPPNVQVNKPSSNTIAAMAAANAIIERKKQSDLEAAAAKTSLIGLGPQFERFSLADSIDSSNLLGLRSIVDNTAAAAAANSSSNILPPRVPGSVATASVNSTNLPWWSDALSSGSSVSTVPAVVVASNTVPVVATQTPVVVTTPVMSTISASIGSGLDERGEARVKLLRVFTIEQVDQVMRQYPNERDYKKLTYYANEMFFE